MDIRLVNLTRIFADKNSEVRAVDNLDITIPSGKLIGLLGPSGCGKSTTLYMIAGLLEPSSGQIFFGDEDATTLSPEKRGIGLVFQNYALYPHMTVKQNIMFPLQNMKLPKAEILQRTVKYAKLVGIEELLNRKPKQLSGGQQQRVAIARALVKEPRVLLLDEPLSNLDARLRLQTREEIRRLQKETGVTTIFVTHDQEEAMSISDEIVVMKDGLEQQRAEPQEVYNNPTNLFVAQFLGTPPINVFTGTIKDNKVYIGEDMLFETTTPIANQDVYVGIRPEGFVVKQSSGVLNAEVEQIETLGRDISIVCKNENCLKPTFKAIVDADTKVKVGKIKLGVKKNKVLVFNRDTSERVI